MKKLSIILLCTLLILLFTGCRKNVYPLTVTDFMLDTLISITIYDGDTDALNGAVKLCKTYEELLSKTVKTSDIYKINHSNGTPLEVSPDTAELLQTALDIAERSGGAFDPTIMPLVEIWNVRNRTAPPCDTEILKLLEYVSFKSVKINGNFVTAEDNTKIDLGGIAKGFIADKVKLYLISKGVSSGIINLGGNTLLIGSKKGQDFSVGLQKPFGKSGELSATLLLTDKTAVTSGVYQRYFKYEDKIYHHIINPETGYPTDNGLYSVTVIADSSSLADGLSTACLNLGTEKGTALAKSCGAELIFITGNGELILTDGLTETVHDGKKYITLKQ